LDFKKDFLSISAVVNKIENFIFNFKKQVNLKKSLIKTYKLSLEQSVTFCEQTRYRNVISL